MRNSLFNEDYREGYRAGRESALKELKNVNPRDLAKRFDFRYDSVAEVFISKNKYVEVSQDGSKYQLFNNIEKHQYDSDYFHLFAEDVINADKLIKELNRNW